MIIWTDNPLSAGFQALCLAIDGGSNGAFVLYRANVEVSRTAYTFDQYEPLLPNYGTWRTRPSAWPTVNVGPGRWAKSSPLFTVTPVSDTIVYGWLWAKLDSFGVTFGEKLWPGGLLLKAGDPFKFQVTLILSDGCPSCVC